MLTTVLTLAKLLEICLLAAWKLRILEKKEGGSPLGYVFNVAILLVVTPLICVYIYLYRYIKTVTQKVNLADL